VPPPSDARIFTGVRLRGWLYDFAVVLCLAALDLVLYHKVLRLWWTYDDVNNLRTVFDYTLTDPYFNAAVWPQQLFTPLMVTAFSAGLKLFALNVFRWYVAQLAIVCVMTAIVFGTLRLFLSRGPAASASFVFAAAVPLCSVVMQLSTVHYLIAITLGALATACYACAIRHSKPFFAAASAVLYLIAMLAKEIAVPLPLFLIALPVGRLRMRVRYASTHLVASACYFLWRHAVIGTFLGAYSWAIELSEWPHLILNFPRRVLSAEAGANFWAGGFLIAVMLCVILIAGLRSRSAQALIVTSIVATIGPLLPLAKEINRRHVLLAWLAVAIAFAASAWTLRNKRLRALLLVAIPLVTIVVNRAEWRYEFPRRLRMSDEARFFFSMPPNGLLRNPLVPPPVMLELRWLIGHLQRPQGGAWFFDDYFLCANDFSGKRLWEFDETRRAIVEITPRVPALAAEHCRAIRWSAPLTVRFRYVPPALHWDLGPYRDGQFSALIGDGLESFELPPREALNLPGVKALTLRIRYASPQGWNTYSPNLNLDLTKPATLQWQRQ